LLAQYQGSLINKASLSKEVGVSAPTIESYLKILEQTYVCYPLPPYSTNLANEIKKSRKYFLFDLGIRNGLLSDFETRLESREDKGALAETFIFLSLYRQQAANTGLYFWRTKQKGMEVDFVWLRNRKAIPVEVKSNLSELIIPKGIKAFIKQYPKTKAAVVFNQNQVGEKIWESCKVQFKKWHEVDEFDQFF
jgi:predicted AAA+ superfamily ATPase